jgi:hypothetical protein
MTADGVTKVITTHPLLAQGRTSWAPTPELNGLQETVEKRFNKRLAGQH